MHLAPGDVVLAQLQQHRHKVELQALLRLLQGREELQGAGEVPLGQRLGPGLQRQQAWRAEQWAGSTW